MSSIIFSLENCLPHKEYIKCGIKHQKYYFNNQKGFKAIFPIFTDNSFNKINSLISDTVKEYSTYSDKTNCKKLVFTFCHKTDNYFSLLLECYYRDYKRIKGINFDLSTMLPLPANFLLKDLKVSKKKLKTVAKDKDVLYDSIHIFSDELRFFAQKNSTISLLSLKKV